MVEDISPFIKDVLKLKLHSLEHESLSIKMKLKPKFWLRKVHTEQVSQTHSGLLAAIIDHAGGLCAWTVLRQPGQLLSTVDLAVDYCTALVPTDQGLQIYLHYMYNNEMQQKLI
jgi:acyl-coenzyme A thioesterase PaaI-like protein